MIDTPLKRLGMVVALGVAILGAAMYLIANPLLTAHPTPPAGAVAAPAASPTTTYHLLASTSPVQAPQSVVIGLQSTSSKLSFGVAECPAVVTTTAEDGGGLVTNEYALYENSSTGISFCYPSYLTIHVETSTRLPIPLIIWPSGERMEFYPSQEIPSTASSVVDRVLSMCEYGGSRGELSCIPPQEDQIIRAQNLNGFDFAVFWTDTVNVGAVPTLIYNSSTGPFAYIDTPGDRVVFIPDISSPASVPVIQDLVVILNTLNVTKPL